MIFFGYHSGQRLMDVAHLKWASIDLRAGVIRFATAKT
jgi:integrase